MPKMDKEASTKWGRDKKVAAADAEARVAVAEKPAAEPDKPAAPTETKPATPK
jgi:hypothetical protein